MINEQQSVFPKEAMSMACDSMSAKLGKALSIGMVRGLVGIVGGDDAPDGQAAVVAGLARELIRQDILVLVTGGAVGPMGRTGLLTPAGAEEAGSGLAEFCDHCGIPPVLPVDDSADGAYVLALFTALASTLGVAIDALPVAAGLLEDRAAQGISPGRGETAGKGLAADLVRAGLGTLFGEALPACFDPGETAGAIGARITAKRLALGFNDRFDGSVYS